jgi:hypothetical protein
VAQEMQLSPFVASFLLEASGSQSVAYGNKALPTAADSALGKPAATGGVL